MKSITTLALSVLVALPFSASAAIFSHDPTSLSSPVAPGGTVNGQMTVTLSGGDDWRATRVQVSVPGPNNDIDVCIDTPDNTSNGTHTETFSFTAPSLEDDYTATINAYEFIFGGNCFGDHHGMQRLFTVAVPAPVDVCPNVTGDQPVGPCADTLCVSPHVWSNANQVCEAPAPVVSSPTAPVSVLKGGGGMCNPATGYPECQQPQNYAHFGAAMSNEQALISLYQKLLNVLTLLVSELN